MARHLNPGDLVATCFFNSLGIKELYHYGIIAHNTSLVYHFDVKKSLNSNDPKNKFHATSWSIFLEGAIDIENRQIPSSYTPEQVEIAKKAYIVNIKFDVSPEIVLERAKILENLTPKYFINKSNCEHTAVWCRTGEWRSFQTKFGSNLVDFLLERKKLVLIPLTKQRHLLQGLTNIIEESLRIINQGLSQNFRNYRQRNPNNVINRMSILFTETDSNPPNNWEKIQLQETYFSHFTFHRNYSDYELSVNNLPENLFLGYQNYKKITIKNIEKRKMIENIEIRKTILVKGAIIVGVIFISLLSIIFILQQCGVIKSGNQPSSEAPTTKPSSPSKIKSNDSLYTVEDKKDRKETLSDISLRCYGDASQWHKIQKANQDKIPKGKENYIKPGWELKIPGGCQGDLGEKK
ncbi:lecithin retinol acyltransferase family protein [Nostoc sp.]|uniref:lecithin retinol acyltransferase family protein n=1 Tax=Nostoc sp. TaxID=1180 RepID=UPI002FFAE2A2